MTERGTLTLPASMRKALGVKGKQHFLADMEEDGSIRLRPADLYPIEIYTDERIAEFDEQDRLLGEYLKSRGK